MHKGENKAHKTELSSRTNRHYPKKEKRQAISNKVSQFPLLVC